MLHEFENTRPADFGQDFQVAADEEAPATRRLRALQRLLRRDPDHDRVRTILEHMSRHEDATLRAAVASIAGALPDKTAEAFFARALADADPQVRAAVILPLIAKRAAEGEDAQISSIKRLLRDNAPDVRRNVLLAIRRNELNTEALRSALRNTAISEPQLAREQAMLLNSLERASRTSLQRLWDDLLDPGNYGVFAFIAVAALAIAAFAYFLLYFAARCVVYLSARRWRALAALGIVATWLVASFALGWAFFIGALVGGGHGSAPPLADQLLVVGLLLLLVSVYALLGLGLRRLISV